MRLSPVTPSPDNTSVIPSRRQTAQPTGRVATKNVLPWL